MRATLKATRFNLEMELKRLGVPAYILVNANEDELIKMLRLIPKNPWSFYNYETGFSIKLCEEFAKNFGINDSIEKAKAYYKYALDKIAQQGHTYAKEWQINHTIESHNFTDEDKKIAIDHLQKEGDLFISRSNNYFLSKYFNAEKSFANLLIRLDKNNGYFSGFQKSRSFLYDKLTPNQQEAVNSLEYNGLTILTGLPGTGKTTSLRAIVDCYGEENIILLAPTGKAANRMSDLCNMHASTLHSFFYNPYSCNKIIENKIIIVDEMSMCDAEMAGWLGNGIGENCVLLLVGDENQLSSVGPGEILKNIVDSKIGLHYHLTDVLRQKPGSIIKSAHSIHAGNNIICGNDNEVMTYYPVKWNLEKIAEKICKHPEYRNAQFLCPLKQKGSQIINNVAQDILNPHSHKGYRIGDKVIHTVNNKDLGVYNGEIGHIVKINDKIISVMFKDKKIDYPLFMSWQLDLAYCTTIHKAQGSEFKTVAIFALDSRISTRNLLYTAITRAQSKVLIVAPSENVIINMIANIEKSRQTSLKWMLSKEIK